MSRLSMPLIIVDEDDNIYVHYRSETANESECFDIRLGDIDSVTVRMPVRAAVCLFGALSGGFERQREFMAELNRESK